MGNWSNHQRLIFRTLRIKKKKNLNDSIIYEVVGYQLFQKYQLIVNEVDTETLKLSYFKTMGGIKNSLLTENTDFGTILYKKGEYTLISKYISLKNGEISNKSYPLKKVY